ALGLNIHKNDLGGADVHARGSGLADNEAVDEEDALQQVRRFLSYLPSNVYEIPPVRVESDPTDRRDEELLSMIPRDRQRPYNVRAMINHVVDRDSGFEIGRYFGGSLITVLARIGGRPVAVLANDPMIIGGSMDAAAASKMEKFVDMSDTFNLPVVNFCDQPGFFI